MPAAATLDLRTVCATRYVTPLREGGSLPGLMEADDLGTYVVKWRAAGQGVKVLVAEVVCGELARALDLPVPALVTVDVAAEPALGEPDPEIQGPMQRSAGRNLGLATGAYNDFVGSLESQVLTQAKRFETLKVETSGKTIEQVPIIETSPRPLTKLSTFDQDDDPPQIAAE